MESTSQMLIEALELMGIGIGLVFVVLTIFFFAIRLMTRIFPFKAEED